MNTNYSAFAKVALFLMVAVMATSAWCARPSESPTCKFTGGAYYKSKNTVDLGSFAVKGVRV